MAHLTYVESLRQSLHHILAEDPKALILGEDVLDPYGGAFKVTKGLSSQFPNRVFTTPICEVSIVGVATGLALRGLHPIAEIMFGDFLLLAADQLVNHAAKYRTIYGTPIPIPLVVRTPMGGGRGYGPTHSQSLEKHFQGVPGLTVLAPSHFHDAGQLLKKAVGSEDAVLFLENKLLYPQPLKLGETTSYLRREERHDLAGWPHILLHNYSPELQPDITIITYGGVSRAIEALLEQCHRDEIWVLVCLCGSLNPLPVDLIVECSAQCGRVIVVEEGSSDFGWGAEVASRIYEALYGRLLAPIQRLGATPTVIPASKPLEDEVLVSAEKILRAVLSLMQW